jgi:hypothetical protein
MLETGETGGGKLCEEKTRGLIGRFRRQIPF